MPDKHISVPLCTLSTVVAATNRLANHISLCHASLAAHADGALELSPTIETLAETALELRQINTLLHQFSEDSPQMLLVLEHEKGGAS